MRMTKFAGIIVSLFALIAACNYAEAATVAQWTFDEPSGNTFFDSSGNGFDLQATFPFPLGTGWHRDTDQPSVAPAGGMSLNGDSARVIDSPSSDRFSLGKTGAMTVEFWYKDTPEASQVVDYVFATASTANNRLAAWLDGGDQIWFLWFDKDGGQHIIKTPDGAITEAAGWQHIAATWDSNVGNGEARVYINGAEVATSSTFGDSSIFLSHNAPVRVMGNGSAESFNGNNLIDELRVSDVALLPGNGTGVGELAWNATLVPEPVTGGLLGVGVLLLLARRGRGQGA